MPTIRRRRGDPPSDSSVPPRHVSAPAPLHRRHTNTSRVVTFLLLCAAVQLVMAIPTLSQLEWPRGDESWVPVPETMDGDDIEWSGQSKFCTALYGNFLANYVDNYIPQRCLNRTQFYAYVAAHDIEPVPMLIHGDSDVAPYRLMPNDTVADEGTCARSCFNTLPSIMGDTSVQPPDAPAAVPNIPYVKDGNATENIPNEFINGIFDANTKECYCFGLQNAQKMFECDTSLSSNQTCTNGDCGGLVWLALPLGCLFTGHTQCIEAPQNSCLWRESKKDPNKCCVDSIGFEWRHFSPRPWMLAGLAIPLIFLSFVRVFVRNLTNARRPVDTTNTLETELIEKHKLKYEIYLQKLMVEVQLGATISQCSICLTDLTEAQCGKFPCGHKLHYDCMKDYIMYQIEKSKKKYPECPVCRQRVLLDDESESDVDVPERIAPAGLHVVVSESPLPLESREDTEGSRTSQSQSQSQSQSPASTTPPRRRTRNTFATSSTEMENKDEGGSEEEDTDAATAEDSAAFPLSPPEQPLAGASEHANPQQDEEMPPAEEPEVGAANVTPLPRATQSDDEDDEAPLLA